jgi:DNA repair protein RadC
MAMERRLTPLQAVELWELLRESVVRRSPQLGVVAAERASLDWRNVTPRDRASVAIAVALDRDPDAPAIRRQSRELLQKLESHFTHSESFAVQEESLPRFEVLTAARQIALWHDVQFVSSEAMAELLKKAAGPVSAMRAFERETTLLKAARAARFLSLIGFPVPAPDLERRRWLHRLGVLENSTDNTANRRRTIQFLDDLALQVGVSPAEVDVLSAGFTGSIECDAAVCTARPSCRNCALRDHCPTGAASSIQSVQEAPTTKGRTLATTVLPEDRPREKLKRSGAESLATAELIAILIRTGNTKGHAVELGSQLLRQFGTLERLSKASVAEISEVGSLGEVKAITIKAAFELARRLRQAPTEEAPRLDRARAVFDTIGGEFFGLTQERFVCLLLSTKLRLMRTVVVSIGLLDQALAHPREIFKEAIRDSAHSVIFVHNHPSGDPTPSRADDALTTRLVQAGDLLGITVRDHIIISDHRFFSYADEGRLRS